MTKNKYARDDPDYTPNNYDIIINKDDINPSLLPEKHIIELHKEIAELKPLTKNIHIIVENDDKYITPIIRFNTSLWTDRGERIL